MLQEEDIHQDTIGVFEIISSTDKVEGTEEPEESESDNNEEEDDDEEEDDEEEDSDSDIVPKKKHRAHKKHRSKHRSHSHKKHRKKEKKPKKEKKKKKRKIKKRKEESDEENYMTMELSEEENDLQMEESSDHEDVQEFHSTPQNTNKYRIQDEDSDEENEGSEGELGHDPNGFKGDRDYITLSKSDGMFQKNSDLVEERYGTRYMNYAQPKPIRATFSNNNVNRNKFSNDSWGSNNSNDGWGSKPNSTENNTTTENNSNRMFGEETYKQFGAPSSNLMEYDKQFDNFYGATNPTVSFLPGNSAYNQDLAEKKKKELEKKEHERKKVLKRAKYEAKRKAQKNKESFGFSSQKSTTRKLHQKRSRAPSSKKKVTKKPEKIPPQKLSAADFKKKSAEVVMKSTKDYFNKGKIKSKDDFKHLSRKFTHTIIEKQKEDFTWKSSTPTKISSFIDQYFERHAIYDRNSQQM